VCVSVEKGKNWRNVAEIKGKPTPKGRKIGRKTKNEESQIE
jgi:hypothetical protein